MLPFADGILAHIFHVLVIVTVLYAVWARPFRLNI